MYWLYWLPASLSQKCKYSSCWGINLLNLAVYMWLECFCSFLVLQLIDAIPKWHNAKDSKDTEQYPPSHNKSQPTMVLHHNSKKEHPMFLASSKPPVHLPCSLKLGSVIVFVLKYRLTSPYRYLYNTDTSLLRPVRLVTEMSKIIHSLPL